MGLLKRPSGLIVMPRIGLTDAGLHADSAKTRAALMRVSALLQEWVVRVTEQLNPTTVWILVCDHIKHIIASIGHPQSVRLITNPSNGST